MSEKSSTPLQILVNQSEIADRFAGGSRSQVANWFVRYEGSIPGSVRKEGRSPLYDARRMFDWLVEDDQSPIRTFGRRDLPDHRWWWTKTAELLQGATSEPDDDQKAARSGLAALVLLRSAAIGDVGAAACPGRWQELVDHFDLETLCELASDIERKEQSLHGLLFEPLDEFTLDISDWPTLLERLELAGSEASGPELVSDALWGHNASWARSASMTATAPPLAEVIADLGSPSVGATILDPACGEGGLLVQCARVAVADSEDERPVVYGQEYDIASWRIARSVLLLGGVAADLGVPGRDSIDQSCWDGIRADLVVVDTPVADSSTDRRHGDAFGHPPDAWLRWAVSHLADDGRLVIVLPGYSIGHVSSARRQPSGHLRDELQELADAGRVETVLLLPSRTRSDISGPLTVWVISGPGVSHADSLLLDTLGSKISSSATVLGLPAQIAGVGGVVAGWRRDHAIPASDDSLNPRAVPAFRIVDAVTGALVDIDSSRRSGRLEDLRAQDSRGTGAMAAKQQQRQLQRRIDSVRPVMPVELAAERIELLAHVDAIIEELEDHIETLAVDDPERYQRLRGRVKALRTAPRS